VRWMLLLLAAGALGGGVFLHLQPPQPPVSRHLEPWMARLDADEDGHISRSEYVQISDGLIPFDLVDMDSSGTIGIRELEVFIRTVDPMWTFAEPD